MSTAQLTPAIAQDLMYRAMTGGAPSGEFNRYGGFDEVQRVAYASGVTPTPEWIASYAQNRPSTTTTSGTTTSGTTTSGTTTSGTTSGTTTSRATPVTTNQAGVPATGPTAQAALDYWRATGDVVGAYQRLAESAGMPNLTKEQAAAGVVSNIYEKNLGRPPDPAGGEFYKNQILSGVPYDTVLNAIKGSPEKINKTINVVPTEAVTRVPSPINVTPGGAPGATAPGGLRFAAPQRGIATLRGQAYMPSLLNVPVGATNITSDFGGPKPSAAGLPAIPQPRPQVEPFILQTGVTLPPPIARSQNFADFEAYDPATRARAISGFLYPNQTATSLGAPRNISAADLANTMGAYGVTTSDIVGIRPPAPAAKPAPAPAPVFDYGGARAGGLVTYKEGGMSKLSAKEAGSQFDMSEFLDKQGRLVGGFLRPESRPDRRVPDEYGAYGRPVRDESGKITNYEFVPYQSNVVFNPALREAEARGMSPEEREAALREMLVRQGLTGISPSRGGLPGIIPREPIMRERPQYYSYAEGGLAGLGQSLASQGRYGDSMLVHMSPEEVQGLRGLAMQMGGDLTINPQTGLPEAFKLKKLFRAILPMLPFLIPGIGSAIAGFGKSAFGLSALASKSIAAGLIGGFTAPGKGFNFKAGLRTGIMAFAGGKLAEGLQAAGQTGVSTGPGSAGGTTAPSMPRAITADQIMANNPNMFPADAAQAASNLNTATQTAMGAPATALPIPTETGAQLPPAEVAAASQVPAGTPSLTTTPTVQGVKEAGTGFKNIISGSPEASAAFTQAVGVKPSTAFTIGTTASAALAPDPEEEERKRLAEEQRQRQKVFDDLYARTLGRMRVGAGGGIVALAEGGMPTFEYGGTTAPTGEPRMVQGAGDGMSDNVPASIEGVQEARLANDEFVVPADVVADIGNGSSNAGAKKLYAMMDRIRKARHGTTEQPPEIDAERLMPA